MAQSGSVLVVEDEALIAMVVSDMFEDLGYAVCGHAASGGKAIEMAAEHRPGTVLLDLRIKGPLDGIATAEAIRAELPDCRIFFATGNLNPEDQQRVTKLAANGVLHKPFHASDLAAMVGRAA